jgi:hypothetical protein
MPLLNAPTIDHADRAFLTFLAERLVEELAAARRRVAAGTDAGEVTERGLGLMREIVLDLEAGTQPHRVSLGILRMIYAGHPDFRAEWSARAIA